MLLSEETECFCFLAGHESFAAAEGAIGIARNANKARKKPLRVILNGLGKDAAMIISRINGFTYVQTEYDQFTAEAEGHQRDRLPPTASVRLSAATAPMTSTKASPSCKAEKVGVSITGNSTNPVRFQHLVAGTYKKWANENGVKYFSVASGGGTGRTLHPDNVAAGPASYGLTDTLGRVHSSAQFAGSSSVPAHVEMMGLIGMGNNPMVGATVACRLLSKKRSSNFYLHKERLGLHRAFCFLDYFLGACARSVISGKAVDSFGSTSGSCLGKGSALSTPASPLKRAGP